VELFRRVLEQVLQDLLCSSIGLLEIVEDDCTGLASGQHQADGSRQLLRGGAVDERAVHRYGQAGPDSSEHVRTLARECTAELRVLLAEELVQDAMPCAEDLVWDAVRGHRAIASSVPLPAGLVDQAPSAASWRANHQSIAGEELGGVAGVGDGSRPGRGFERQARGHGLEHGLGLRGGGSGGWVQAEQALDQVSDCQRDLTTHPAQ
jgi:hypothetical protein